MDIFDSAYKQIRKHCKKNSEEESCGYIFGNGIIAEIAEGKNLDKSSGVYTIDPETTFKSVFRDDFKGVYHSHMGEAIPSGIDVNRKKHKDKYYLIYSLAKDEIRSYLWDGKKFTEEKVEIIKDWFYDENTTEKSFKKG